MKCLGINSHNDLYLTPAGNVALVDGRDAVRDACKQAVQARLGEMAFAADKGVPMQETVFGGAPNLAQFEVAIRAILSGVDGVTGVDRLTVKRDGQKLAYSAAIRTIYGSFDLG